MVLNSDSKAFKKGFAGIFLGTQVLGKQDLPIVGEVKDRVYNVPFLVTGVSGVRQGDKVVDYDFVLESLDGEDHQLCVSFDIFRHYFEVDRGLEAS